MTLRPPIPAEVIDLVERARLGHVATLTADGRPHVSPKGTVWIPDNGDRVGFAHIHSERTIDNLHHDPYLTVSVVDVFQRRGTIIWGTARIYCPGAVGFDQAADSYRARRGSVPEAVHAFVLAEITAWEPVVSPTYDNGSDVPTIEARWRAFYQRQYPRTDGA